MRPFVYLACPYTDPDTEVREGRLRTFADAAAALESTGNCHVLSGLLATTISSRADLPDDYAFWGSYSESMLRLCKEVWLIELPGWTNSVGVQAELNLAIELGLPIYRIIPPSPGKERP